MRSGKVGTGLEDDELRYGQRGVGGQELIEVRHVIMTEHALGGLGRE